MEQTQDKPVRKRRRWLIVAFVLVLVSTVAWWCWPRRDPKLFGVWSVTRDSQALPFGTYEFRADGTYLYHDRLNNSEMRTPIWSVSDGKVFIGLGVPGEAGRLFRNWSFSLNRWFGSELIRSALPLVIDSIDDDLVVLRSEDRVVKLTLRRLPE